MMTSLGRLISQTCFWAAGSVSVMGTSRSCTRPSPMGMAFAISSMNACCSMMLVTAEMAQTTLSTPIL